MSLTIDANYDYTLRLYDEDSNRLQSILLGRIPEGVDFMDVNLDGYTDVIANMGVTQKLIWDGNILTMESEELYELKN